MMKRYARIQDGVVFEFFETDGDITQMFHPSLVWIEITDLDPQPECGWIYQDGAFSPPPEK